MVNSGQNKFIPRCDDMTADELRAIADKLDELNGVENGKERTSPSIIDTKKYGES
jgi:hypothetical protein